MNRRLSSGNYIFFIRMIAICVIWTVLYVSLIIIFVIVIWKVILRCIVGESSILIVLHLPALIHIDMTLSIWGFLTATVVVQSNWRILFIRLIVDWSVAYSFLWHCCILYLPLISCHIFLGWLILRNRGLVVIICICTNTCIFIVFKVIGSVVSIITRNRWWLRHILGAFPWSRYWLTHILTLWGCFLLILATAYVVLSFLGTCVIVNLRCLLNHTSFGLVIVILQLWLSFLRVI